MTDIKGVSLRKFADLDGCDESLVRRKVKSGHLAKLPNGKIDPALAGSAWRERPGEQALIVDPDLSDEAIEIVNGQDFSIPQKAVSEAKKEAYLAELRKLEYEREKGLVIDVADIAGVCIQELLRIRTKLLSIPVRAAPKLALMKTANQMKAFLNDEIALVLEELVSDVKPPIP